MKTITIKSVKGKSYSVNPALIAYIEQSEPDIGLDPETGKTWIVEDSFNVAIIFTGASVLKLLVLNPKDYDASELKSNHIDIIDIAEYKKFLNELEAA